MTRWYGHGMVQVRSPESKNAPTLLPGRVNWGTVLSARACAARMMTVSDAALAVKGNLKCLIKIAGMTKGPSGKIHQIHQGI